MHVRQQILSAIANRLKPGGPSWRTVYASGVLPGTASLPCVLVRATSEQVDPLDIHTGQMRTLTLSTLAVRRADSNPEDATRELNAAAVALESLLTIEAIRNEVDIISLTLTGTEINEEIDENGFVSIDLQWSLEYATHTGQPEQFMG